MQSSDARHCGSECNDLLGLVPDWSPELEHSASAMAQLVYHYDDEDPNGSAEFMQRLRAAATELVAAERERWEQERKDYRSLLMQARVVLRGPHTEQNTVVRELVARIEARGVQFRA